MDKKGQQSVIMRHVLPFLPAKSLCKLRAVCKDWDKWITNSFFTHQQANYFREISGFFCQTPDADPTFISLDEPAYGIPSPSLSFLPGNVTVRSSCNGLLCCQSHFGDTESYIICNPVNEEWAELPQPRLYHGPESALALAFEPSPLNFAAHFELVCAIPDGFFVNFEIYSSRTNSWRVAESEYYCEADSLRLNRDGFYTNGYAYWETLNGSIIAFNLKDDQYGELQLPPDHGLRGVLTKMQGQLRYIMPRKNENSEWSLEIYGEHNMALQYQILLDLRDFKKYSDAELRFLASVNDNVLIILLGRSVIAYHVRETETKMVNMVSFADGFGRFLPYVNSLVSVSPLNRMPADEVAD